MKSKLLKLAAILPLALIGQTALETVPETGIVVSTETVTKTVSREPRIVVLLFDDAGQVSAEVNYETVTRFGTNIVSRAPFKSVSLTWQQVTNLVPSLAQGLDEFKVASKASMTNTP